MFMVRLAVFVQYFWFDLMLVKDYDRTIHGLECRVGAKIPGVLDITFNKYDYIHPALPAMLEKIGTGEKGCRENLQNFTAKNQKRS